MAPVPVDELLVTLATLLLGLLTGFGIYLFLTGIAGLGRHRSPPEVPIADDGPRITFIIAAYGEGDRAVDCLDSVLAADYPPHLLDVLIAVDEDTQGTIEAVRRRVAPIATRSTTTRGGDEMLHAPRITAVFQTGERAGKGKPQALTNCLSHATKEGYIGILDADHTMDPDFPRKALRYFTAPDVAAVQGRRMQKEPHANWLARWDVLEQNMGQVQTLAGRDRVGCAGFNGSTALIRADLLHEVGWEDHLTEDTALHYALRARGYRCRYEPTTGSREEHVVHIRSFILQRRRWAAGHMAIMSSMFGRLTRSSLRLVERVDAAFHLVYYGVAVVLLGYWLTRAAHYWVQEPAGAAVPAVLGSIAIGAVAALVEPGHRQGDRSRGFIVGALMGFSFLSLVIPIAAPPASPVPFPWQLELVLFSMPLLQMAFGYVNPLFRPSWESPTGHVMNWTTLVVAAPIMLVVNMYATLTGALMTLDHRNHQWDKTWRPTKRSQQEVAP